MKAFIFDWIKTMAMFGVVIALGLVVSIFILSKLTAAWQIVILFLALTFCLTMLTR